MKKYQTAYLKAQTQEAKAKVMNRAQLNLIASDFNNFVKWQVEQMNADEPQHGGKREGAGRKPKFKQDEETVTIAFRVPVSKEKEIKTAIEKLLQQYVK